MNTVTIVVGSCTVLCGVVMVALGIPLFRGKIPRNPVYGIRTRASFSCDESWDLLNRFGGKSFIRWGMVIALLGIVVFILPPTVGFMPLIAIGVIMLSLLPALEIWRFTRSRGL